MKESVGIERIKIDVYPNDVIQKCAVSIQIDVNAYDQFHRHWFSSFFLESTSSLHCI